MPKFYTTRNSDTESHVCHSKMHNTTIQHHTHKSDKPNSSNRETEEMRGKKTQRKLENELAYLMKYHVWSSLIRMPNSCARSPVIMSIKSSNFWLPLRWNSLTLMVHVSPQIPYRGQLFNASSWCHWFLWYFCVSKVEIV